MLIPPEGFATLEGAYLKVFDLVLRNPTMQGAADNLPSSINAYHDATDAAAWALTRRLVAEEKPQAVVVLASGVERPFSLERIACLSPWPRTPWGNMRSGVLGWDQEAFEALIPEDFGQRREWKAWVGGLEGASIFMRLDGPPDKVETASGGSARSGNDKRKVAAIAILQQKSDAWLKQAGRQDADRLIAKYFKQNGLREYKGDRSAGNFLRDVRRERGIKPDH